MKLIRRPQQGALPLGPLGPRAIAARPLNVATRQAGILPEPLVVAPLVLTSAVVSDSENHKLGVLPREGAARHQPPGEHQPAAEQTAPSRGWSVPPARPIARVINALTRPICAGVPGRIRGPLIEQP